MSETLPIFPLFNVLFPQGRMPLRVFEARYLDMVAQCMRTQTHFGICLIAEGQEVAGPAVPYGIGVEALIIDWDMSQPGVLAIDVAGARRFVIDTYSTSPQGVIMAEVQWLPPAVPVAVVERFASLSALMRALIDDLGDQAITPPHQPDDADWLGYRFAEILPLPAQERQRLLEMDDATQRLSVIHRHLIEQGMLA